MNLSELLVSPMAYEPFLHFAEIPSKPGAMTTTTSLCLQPEEQPAVS